MDSVNRRTAILPFLLSKSPTTAIAASIPPANSLFRPSQRTAGPMGYQQMMFNAQQGFPHMPPQHHSSQQRNVSNPTPSADYFAQNQISPAFNPFPSGTPPPHQGHRGGAGDHPQQLQQQNGQYNGFHPYRRPSRQPTPHTPEGNEWRPSVTPQPPYARPDASGSTSSVNSSSSQRQRTNSNQSGHSGHNVPSTNGSSRSRSGPPVAPGSNTSTRTSSSPSSAATSSPLRMPHHRNSSSSSSGSTATSNRPSVLSPSLSTTTASASSASTPPSTAVSGATLRPARPSPLSQGNFTASEKRMSRDDSDLAAMRDPTPSASMMRSGGLKGRLRRALSFNAAQTLREEDTDDDVSIKASAVNGTASSSKLGPKSSIDIDMAVKKPGGGVRSPDSGVDDGASTATVQTKKKGRAASLFNSRLNASTDNISLSSTVSSASVMIRKLGSMGKLARRNSLAGITSLFKEKDKDKSGDGKDKDKKGKKKDKDKKASGSKGEASEASVSHVTAELDRVSGDWNVGGEMSGLSPAAKLARQHTLKSNAEAAAKAKAQQEAAAAAAAVAATATTHTQVNGHASSNGAGVPAWDKNTATRQGVLSPIKTVAGVKVNEDGTRILVEDDDDDESDEVHPGSQQAGQSFHADGWDDDDDWDIDPEAEAEEDVTIRIGMERASVDDDGYAFQEEPEPWAVDVRRSVEKARRPAKGILKYAGSYDQQSYLAEQPVQRVRSNSYNSHPGHTSELGPLARIPSPDPDHIDGLHRHPSHSSSHGPIHAPTALAPTIPPLSFESSPSPTSPSPKDLPDLPMGNSHAVHYQEKASAIFNHPNLNSSAPALSTITNTPPSLTHRSATAPSKRLAFASNLSVYDTFSASVYDRRSEPATWSRLTPALAQRIKEELNSYKMEEMEVHAASRVQYVYIS
ncbi:hypothetical protein BD779DRAFT_1685896 [Infundibulicybe gibba]|nr:hypothetical protein BD779DRAFT_1685896 [Infundibulicybe gibba]